jgi:hypothetical protein
MTRGSIGAERARDGSIYDGVKGLEHAARGEQSNVIRLWANVGVTATQHGRACSYLAFCKVDVRRTMTEFNLVPCRSPRRKFLQPLEESGFLKSTQYSVKPLGALGMPLPGDMIS